MYILYLVFDDYDHGLKLFPEQDPSVAMPKFEHFRYLADNWLLLSNKLLEF